MKVDRLDNGKPSTGVSTSPAATIARQVEKLVAAELARKDGRRLPLYELVIASVEKPLIHAVLHYERWNQSHAALTLGIHRTTLRNKMRDYGIRA